MLVDHQERLNGHGREIILAGSIALDTFLHGQQLFASQFLSILINIFAYSVYLSAIFTPGDKYLFYFVYSIIYGTVIVFIIYHLIIYQSSSFSSFIRLSSKPSREVAHFPRATEESLIFPVFIFVSSSENESLYLVSLFHTILSSNLSFANTLDGVGA